MQVLLQYQSKSYYIIGQEVYYSIGRFITLSGSYYIIGRFYYIIGQLLQYRAFITLSVGTRVLMMSTSFRGIPIVFRMSQRELRSRYSKAALRSM